MATALTPQTDVTSGKSRDWWRTRERKENRLKTQLNIFFSLIKSETSDSFVNHFDGHFAYLKTLDFCFERKKRRTILSSSRTSTPCKSSYLTFLSPELVMHRNPKYPEQSGKRRRYKSLHRSILCNISTGHLKSSKYERACHASNSEISRIKLRENDKVQTARANRSRAIFLLDIPNPEKVMYRIPKYPE